MLLKVALALHLSAKLGVRSKSRYDGVKVTWAATDTVEAVLFVR